MKVYIGFSEPTSNFAPFAWLIKWVEARPYDHCYVRFQEPTGDWMIFQASKEMVNMYSAQVWLQSNKPLKEYEIDINQDQVTALWNHVKSSLGIPYSLIEDLGILLMKIFHLKNNPFSKGMSAEFCSEEAANVAKLLGVAIKEDSDNIDPTLLDSILASLNMPCKDNPVF
jgi:hypothetical protein